MISVIFRVMPFLKLLNCYIAKLLRSEKQFNNGFTLVELLVVMGILAIAVGSSLLFLTSVIKGTNQANVTAEVKQTGQSVLDSLERQIRNAIDAQVVIPGENYLKIIRSGQNPLYIQCFASLANARNGWIGTRVMAEPAIPSGPSDFTSLTNDSDLVSGVDIVCATSPPAFDVITASSTAPPIVSISFSVSQAINAPSRQDFVANAQFQTTISLRQY